MAVGIPLTGSKNMSCCTQTLRFPCPPGSGAKALRVHVYDLIAPWQPEGSVGARDRAELHSRKVDQVIIVLPLATPVIKTFFPDQQPFAVFGPVKRVDRSFALADSAVVIDRASIDLDLEPADLTARSRYHRSLLVAAGFELSQLRFLIATPRPRIRSSLRLRCGASSIFLPSGGFMFHTLTSSATSGEGDVNLTIRPSHVG
jgi:hypothetical protein